MTLNVLERYTLYWTTVVFIRSLLQNWETYSTESSFWQCVYTDIYRSMQRNGGKQPFSVFSIAISSEL